MGKAMRAPGLRRINGDFPDDVMQEAAARLGLKFTDSVATLINAALLTVLDQRVSEEVLRDAYAQAPRRRGRRPLPREDDRESRPALPTIGDECGLSA